MLKVIQITDTHLVPPGQTIFGIDPLERLAAAVADINRDHGDAALCIVTGDLTHFGDAESYAVLRQTLSALRPTCRLVIGNHDDRASLRAAFPELPCDSEGFVQSTFQSPAGRFLFLDTVDPGVHTGRYCHSRQEWLERELSESKDQAVYLFMHHPPFPIALPHLDQYGIVDAEDITRILSRHRNIRHIFCGHVHRPVSGSWRGIPFSALRGTNHQNWLDFKATRINISSLEPPAYAVIFLSSNQTVVHFHDYLDQSPKFAYDPDAPRDQQIRRL